MTVEHFQAPDAPGFKLDPRVVGAFARFAGGYWRGPRGRSAWLLTLGLAACLLLSTAVTIGLNQWNRWFFDSLEARDVEQITHAVFVFALIIACMAAVGVGIVITREMLQVRWRAWVRPN
jgi:putative ATP-binding cassette transporter